MGKRLLDLLKGFSLQVKTRLSSRDRTLPVKFNIS
jgi:hypothetical protein